jgi:hypothetical protein
MSSRASVLLLALPIGFCSFAAGVVAQRPAYVIEAGDAPENSVDLDAEAALPDVEAEPTQDDNPQVQPGGQALTLTANSMQALPTDVADDDPRALQEFGPSLQPYGTWLEDPAYGQIWVPSPAIVGSGFSPYLTGGQWALDTSGNWVWLSDYPFGAIVFHYGRWAFTSSGWGWVPGYRYASAWVRWRVPTGAGAHFGWAPLPPAFVWSHGSAVRLAAPAPYYWTFCPSASVFTRGLDARVIQNTGEARSIARATRVYAPPARGAGSAGPRPRAPSGPSLRVARIPHNVWPSVRVQPGSGFRPPMNAVPTPGSNRMPAPGMSRTPAFRGRTGRH